MKDAPENCAECEELHDPSAGHQQGDATFCCHCECHRIDQALRAVLDGVDDELLDRER